MTSLTKDQPSSAPLRLPAILQHQTNTSLRQVQAYNAQQQEKIQARREAKASGSSGNGGKGKRVVRRRDNAIFASNPHITLPSRSDLQPTYPLHSQPLRAAFPPNAISRSAPVPTAPLITPDPYSPSSLQGAFTTSLKGTRAMLRKRGRRVENLVGIVEGELRDWLGGKDWHQNGKEGSGWKVIDPHMVEFQVSQDDTTTLTPNPGPSRRLPPQYWITQSIPGLPISNSSSSGQTISAVLELSRSPAHLTWMVADSFERLVVHLICRYYELVSWSEDRPTESQQQVRLTHIIVPSLAKPKAPLGQNALLTPETSDISGPSGSEIEPTANISSTESWNDATSDSETETETEIEGYLNPSTLHNAVQSRTGNIPLNQAMAELHFAPLERTLSASSSVYASSSDGSEFAGLGDSLTLPPLPVPRPSLGGWERSEVDHDELDDLNRTTRPRPLSLGVGQNHHDIDSAGTGLSGSALNGIRVVGSSSWTWQDKPSFFEYLFGA